MPRSQGWGHGRACLMVGVPAGDAVGAALAQAGFSVERASAVGEALVALERRPYVAAFVAQKVGAAAVQALVVRSAQQQPEIPVLILATSAALQDAVDAMQQGAADYLPPPFDAQTVLARLRRVADIGAAPARSAAPAAAAGYAGLVGDSPAMRKVYGTIDKISRYKTNVLLLGESGTGKELVARALHAHGPRRKHLFVPLNCATLGREILENELFGHERGAFTGANERKKGLFELADGGTLFLDEVAEIDPSTQAKLLRVLERNEFRRVGGSDKVKVDLSIIAATNRNLEEAIVAKRFREDLYYRLKVVTIVVPPLRDRKQDIPGLVETFIADFNRRNAGKIRGVSPLALKRLMEHDWPGNVRELKNAVESAAVLATEDTIDLGALSDLFGASPATTARRAERAPAAGAPVPAAAASASSAAGEASIPIPQDLPLAEAERLIILHHLGRSRTKAATARSLGIGLRTLYSKLKDYEPGAR